jgi:trigger factor
MNHDFITKCGVANEDELRKSLRERLQTRLQNQAKSEMAEQIYQYLFEKTDFELPVSVVADQAVSLLRRQYVNLMMQGIQREMIDQHIEQLKSSSEQQAQQQLKIFFIMDKISDKLGIKTTEEEINGHIAQMAIQRKIRPERMKEEMQRDGSLDQFKLQVREQKCVAKLLETAKITEVEPKAELAKPAVVRHKKTAEKTVEKHVKKTPAKAPAKEKPEKKTKRPTRKKKT